jgi:hypothetical protein
MRPAERLGNEALCEPELLHDLEAVPRNADRAAALAQGVLVIEHDAAHAVACELQRRGESDGAGTDYDDIAQPGFTA